MTTLGSHGKLSTRDLFLALLVPVIWGFNFVVMKYAVTEASPMFLVASRFLLAAVPLVFLIPRPKASWPILIGYAVAFAIVKFGILFTAFRLGAPAGIASVVLQMQAIVTVGLAVILFGERPRWREVAGLSVSGLGLVAILSGLADGPALVPVVLVFAAAVAWSVANLINKSAVSADPLGFVVWTSAIASVIAWPIILLVEGPAEIMRTIAGLSWWGFGAILYLAYPVSILSGAIWSRLITRYPAAMVTPFALLTPVIGIASSAFIYGERLSGTLLLGTAAICLGLAIIMLVPRQKFIPSETHT